MHKRRVVLGVTGSIAAYKSAEIISRLREHGCEVFCVMTKCAAKFITPLTLQALSSNKVYSDMFDSDDAWIAHISIAKQADLLLVAPATANVIGKLANGIADDLLSCVALATRAPVVLAPAMNECMYESAPVQENIRRLKNFGYKIVGPKVGKLACGDVGLGHIADVEHIVDESLALLRKRASSNKKRPSR